MNPVKPLRVGVIGCGNISPLYFDAGRRFEAIEVECCSDLLPDRASESAKQHKLLRCASVEEMLSDPAIIIVLNLTVPKAHYHVTRQVLEAGKTIYSEKPLATNYEDGKRLMELARGKNLRVGCAPDTFLGASGQTARKLIDDGAIGRPVAAVAFMLGQGPEEWHPTAEFYYQPGGGPMFDMGPYYLTALINLLGPVQRVTGSVRANFDEKVGKRGTPDEKRIRVEVPTHVAGILDFANGAIATIITSFDVWGSQVPRIEVYGSEGSLSVPDPNCFGGPVMLNKSRSKDWQPVPYTHGYDEQSRGIGVADMASAMRTGRKHRANGDVALHVLEIMHAIHVASETGKHVMLETTCERPAPLPVGLADGQID